LIAVDAMIPVIVAFVALVGSLATGAITLVIGRRKADDSRELGIIHAAQDSLVALVADQRAEIHDLREQVAKMRVELAESLRHHAACEAARGEQDRVIAALRLQLEEETKP
jgi:F0F1-type ATP synthase membrane subunit b/b'